jgi:hypothetical protein
MEKTTRGKLRGENRKWGDMEASNRNLSGADAPPGYRAALRKNCRASGCPCMAGNNGTYCEQHLAEAHHYPMPKQTIEHFGGTSHLVSYPTHVGAPENGKNKL